MFHSLEDLLQDQSHREVRLILMGTSDGIPKRPAEELFEATAMENRSSGRELPNVEPQLGSHTQPFLLQLLDARQSILRLPSLLV
ncbi:MAG: hypothetical protein ACK5AM_18735, partial [Pirellulaceae bacterium]